MTGQALVPPVNHSWDVYQLVLDDNSISNNWESNCKGGFLDVSQQTYSRIS